jgi:pimeloyl-ACP methyl ester carboxylesterase
MRVTRLLLALALSCPYLAFAQEDFLIHDETRVNGHDGYLSAWAIVEPMDKVVMIAAGYDVKNEKNPIEELTGDFATVVDEMGALGWTVIFFDYVDGAADLKENADNLAEFIRYVDTQAKPDYHLAVIGGSMGGIVARTMFAQERDDMGVETYVSVDSPHWGVYFSRWAEELVDVILDSPLSPLSLLIDTPAGRQMLNGHEAYEEHYGGLRAVESSLYFKRNVNRPMDTCAVTLSDASNNRAWVINTVDEAVHNKYYPVASYIDLGELRSSYMPYHSTAYLVSDATKDRHRTAFSKYRYKKRKSQYFDTIIANERDEHAAPEYAVWEALFCVLANGPGAE